MWALIICHFCHNWGTFILLTWMPTYYNQVLYIICEMPDPAFWLQGVFQFVSLYIRILECFQIHCLKVKFVLQVLGFNLMESGLFSVLPWLTMALSANLGGWIADSLVSRGVSVTLVRKVGQFTLSSHNEANANI